MKTKGPFYVAEEILVEPRAENQFFTLWGSVPKALAAARTIRPSSKGNS